MPRFVNQRDRYSCGPLAILNALKWRGRQYTRAENLPLIKKACHCKPRSGTFMYFFGRVAAAMGFTRMYRPSLRKIDETLRGGHAVIVRCRFADTGEEYGHIFLITERSAKSFFCVNVYEGHSWLPKSVVNRRYLKHSLMAWTVRQPASAHLQAA